MVFAVGLAAFAQTPVISSFSQNGQLVLLEPSGGGVATIEWASSLAGPWRTNWVGLDAVTADSNGVIQVSVPMFYRVRATTNAPINHAPMAVDDNDSTSKNTNLVRATSVYLANDTDADNNPLSIASVSTRSTASSSWWERTSPLFPTPISPVSRVSTTQCLMAT